MQTVSRHREGGWKITYKNLNICIFVYIQAFKYSNQGGEADTGKGLISPRPNQIL